MAEDRVVLVVAANDDLGVDRVERLLRLQAPDGGYQVLRVDPKDIGDLTSLTAHIQDGEVGFELAVQGQRADSDRIHSVLWRPQMPAPEGQVQLEALLRTCEGLLWIGGPEGQFRTASPAVQLVAAARAGLVTPHVALGIHPHVLARFEPSFRSGVRFVKWGEPLRPVPGGSLDETLALEHALVCVEHRPFDYRVRLVDVDGHLFAAKVATPFSIFSMTDEEKLAPMEAIAVIPEEVQTAAHLFAAQFGLPYVVLDLGVTADGLWWFQEADAAGDFWKLELDTGQPVSRFLAALLAERRAAS
ncbi:MULTISPECIES: hypothetical protein [Streptomyces]|uniref:hypothetical protein n=1 Tax=Streptomyces TaxID=1883 RepID=UPI0016755A18|nr:hypothetical protein [Streptomyces xanthochromogenes]GHB71367.1 ATP-grasp ribosomal peptide maturase [Streptomyces xanthochromogenes]